ncbi:M23 family metallopeptidase [Peribacillus deserti]|uniref:Peptidase M23 n=1 Tax=Peribacillus deserti TaxID=673318 RepID=A0A2N5M7P3_9BACI|nr:M23 family metallopeptidase [Peribacillus deserti]PLT30355.1 peptidase M23 [Peribacillus deserti]
MTPEEYKVKLRMSLYEYVETVTTIPWYFIAAIDQYEHSVRNARRDLPDSDGPVGVHIDPKIWSGMLNPNLNDENPASIQFWGGLGTDGNSDGKASIKSNEDLLITLSNYLLRYGNDESNFRIGLWNYYKRDKAVGIIMGNARLFKQFGTVDLSKKVFPVPVRTHYTYRGTWGVARGWGGRRTHEGTDIFADYGLPVRSTCYGIIEMKGWNKYGGWRVGIRDINNTYHYFAHLSGFAKGLQTGQTVEPGTLIGGVGSTGYGPPGTSGKFPPHLHYGLYKDNGLTEWSFDPYPLLRVWERNDLRARKTR